MLSDIAETLLVGRLPIKSAFQLAGTCKTLKHTLEKHIARATEAKMRVTPAYPAYTIRDPDAGTTVELMVISPEIIRLKFDDLELFACTLQFNEPTTGMTLYEILISKPQRMWYKRDEHHLTVYTLTEGTVLATRVVCFEYNR